MYYAAADVVILRFMVEVCWAPMLAAFSVPLDQSDDEAMISLCLEGFRYAIHVTAVMSMKTQRDAFVTSLAKFTSLHSAADIKQKNIEAIKVCFPHPFFPIYQAMMFCTNLFLKVFQLKMSFKQNCYTLDKHPGQLYPVHHGHCTYAAVFF